jgi:CDP-4-dehydro-6-deoxyglucose reductase, E1
MIPLMKHAFLDEVNTKKALSEFILTTDKLSMDVQCFTFEKEFAAHQGRKDGILFNSGGSANLAMLQALKNLGRLKDGDPVGFSALTWSTNVMPIIQLGLKPVIIDCDPSTLNVMSKNILDTLNHTPLKAFFTTNALGFTGDLDVIKQLCAEKDIILLEDNCESLGTVTAGTKAGNFGLAASFSFFVAHHMSTIEGGMVCTDDAEYAEMLRIVRANGWDRNLSPKQQKRLRKEHGIPNGFEAKYAFYDLGFNLRPTEITGFLGLNQLKLLEDNIAQRQSNHEFLMKTLRTNSELHILNDSHISLLSGFAFTVICKSPELREKYIKKFTDAEIEIRPVIAGNMQKQPFYKKYVTETYELPGATLIDTCGFYCGNYPELEQNDLETIASCLQPD